jgi:hypothetical protein
MLLAVSELPRRPLLGTWVYRDGVMVYLDSYAARTGEGLEAHPEE